MHDGHSVTHVRREARKRYRSDHGLSSVAGLRYFDRFFEVLSELVQRHFLRRNASSFEQSTSASALLEFFFVNETVLVLIQSLEGRLGLFDYVAANAPTIGPTVILILTAFVSASLAT